jgi:hypothetical protein
MQNPQAVGNPPASIGIFNWWVIFVGPGRSSGPRLRWRVVNVVGVAWSPDFRVLECDGDDLLRGSHQCSGTSPPEPPERPLAFPNRSVSIRLESRLRDRDRAFEEGVGVPSWSSLEMLSRASGADGASFVAANIRLEGNLCASLGWTGNRRRCWELSTRGGPWWNRHSLRGVRRGLCCRGKWQCGRDSNADFLV